jgi:hypothetical protein
MTDQTPDMTPQVQEPQEPFFPPRYLLIVAIAAFAVAFIVALTQPVFGVIGYGSAALGILALLAWVLMAPDAARGAVTGRTARYGGLSVLVTLLLIGVMIAVYSFVRGLKISTDLTEHNDYSLTASARTAITNLGKDPTLPQIKLIAFYGTQQSGRRDQDTVLFDDYAKTSGGKVSYEFIDPDRNPLVVQQYKNSSGTPASNGQIAVAPLDAQGQPDTTKAQIVATFNQDDLSNAILRVSASGDFRAYFLDVDGGLQLSGADPTSMSQLDSTLKQYSWKTQTVTFVDLQKPNSEIKLNDASADGEVVVIPGGDKPLTDGDVKFLTDYLDKGGDLVLFAASSVNDKGESLATTEKLNQYLWDHYGLRFRNDAILDTTQAFQTPVLPVATDLDRSSFVTNNLGQSTQPVLIFDTPHSVEIAPQAPADVTTTALARTSATSFATTDFATLMEGKVEKTDKDTNGPLIVGAQALNAKTGSHIVVFGSMSLAEDQFAAVQSLANFDVSFNSLVWSTSFNDYFSAPTVVSEAKPQDTPIYADTQTIRNINFLTVFVMPFGILAIGIFVWWNNRERARATR